MPEPDFYARMARECRQLAARTMSEPAKRELTYLAEQFELRALDAEIRSSVSQSTGRE